MSNEFDVTGHDVAFWVAEEVISIASVAISSRQDEKSFFSESYLLMTEMMFKLF